MNGEKKYILHLIFILKFIVEKFARFAIQFLFNHKILTYENSTFYSRPKTESYFRSN